MCTLTNKFLKKVLGGGGGGGGVTNKGVYCHENLARHSIMTSFIIKKKGVH